MNPGSVFCVVNGIIGSSGWEDLNNHNEPFIAVPCNFSQNFCSNSEMLFIALMEGNFWRENTFFHNFYCELMELDL